MARKKVSGKSVNSKKIKANLKTAKASSPAKSSALDRQLTAFGERLVMALQAKGMNDSDLAKALGIAQPNIHTLKYKTDRPRSATVMKIAKTLGIEPEVLVPRGPMASLGLGMAAGRETGDGTKVYLVIETKTGRQTVRLA
ncbi:MAG: helix-turn-helix transcriptional regulator [Bdellovibrionaceae bacterium]|nr:helix-turn-helix transcriptional regulator [Pseudobdellovibrionaceae bacterium]